MSKKAFDFNYIPYPGNKTRFCTQIHEVCFVFIKESFIEPFAGSGAFSLFLAKKYPELSITLGEKDTNIFKIHYAFKNGTWSELKYIIDEVHSFGDLKKDKNAYYVARDTLNKKYHIELSINSGFYNWVISTFAINSMLRFGPNGFNQGWGQRGIGRNQPSEYIDESKFLNINSLYKNISLINDNWTNSLNNSNDDTLLFLDPPYVQKGSGTYSFSQEDYSNFINSIKNLSNPILYSDVFSEEILDELGSRWNHLILRENMGVGKPGQSSQQIEKEALYYNFKSSKPSGKSLF